MPSTLDSVVQAALRPLLYVQERHQLHDDVAVFCAQFAAINAEVLKNVEVAYHVHKGVYTVYFQNTYKDSLSVSFDRSGRYHGHAVVGRMVFTGFVASPDLRGRKLTELLTINSPIPEQLDLLMQGDK